MLDVPYLPTMQESIRILLLLILGALAASTLFLRMRRNLTSMLPLPPGPPPLPIIANLLDMPTRKMPLALLKLSEKYGERRMLVLGLLEF